MAGQAERDEASVRYVVQEHSGYGPVHYDFMVEQGGVLLTWQIGVPPGRWSSGPVDARRIANHRLAYLDYQGPVGGGRGVCRIADRGRCRVLLAQPDAVRLEVIEGGLCGTVELTRTGPDEERWELRVAPTCPDPA